MCGPRSTISAKSKQLFSTNSTILAVWLLALFFHIKKMVHIHHRHEPMPKIFSAIRFDALSSPRTRVTISPTILRQPEDFANCPENPMVGHRIPHQQKECVCVRIYIYTYIYICHVMSCHVMYMEERTYSYKLDVSSMSSISIQRKSRVSDKHG